MGVCGWGRVRYEHHRLEVSLLADPIDPNRNQTKKNAQAKTMQAEWQYMLVERMEPPTQTSGGLFLPSNEMVGAEGGREWDASAHDGGEWHW